MAVACWRLFGLKGYARCDFRVSTTGAPDGPEVNGNPSLAPDAGFAAAAAAAGLDFTALVSRLVPAGVERPKGGAQAPAASTALAWRMAPRASDLAAVREIVASSGFFSAEEVAVAQPQHDRGEQVAAAGHVADGVRGEGADLGERGGGARGARARHAGTAPEWTWCQRRGRRWRSSRAWPMPLTMREPEAGTDGAGRREAMGGGSSDSRGWGAETMQHPTPSSKGGGGPKPGSSTGWGEAPT